MASSIFALISSIYGPASVDAFLDGAGVPTDGAPTDGAPTDGAPTDGAPTTASAGAPTDGSSTATPTAGAPTTGVSNSFNTAGLFDFFVIMPMRPTDRTSNPLQTAFHNVRKLDTYLANDIDSIAKIEEMRIKLVAQKEKDDADRQIAVDALLSLITEYNTTYPGAIDTSLEPPLMYRAYLLHQDTLAFNKSVAEARATASGHSGADAAAGIGAGATTVNQSVIPSVSSDGTDTISVTASESA
jgi:hypothetical protein